MRSAFPGAPRRLRASRRRRWACSRASWARRLPRATSRRPRAGSAIRASIDRGHPALGRAGGRAAALAGGGFGADPGAPARCVGCHTSPGAARRAGAGAHRARVLRRGGARLTLEAAARAGLPKPALLEEPQAALYTGPVATAPISPGRWRARGSCSSSTSAEAPPIPPSSKRSRPPRRAGPPVLRRLAVGDHLLLGGDNMDIALAHRVEPRLPAKLGVASGRCWSRPAARPRSCSCATTLPRAPAWWCRAAARGRSAARSRRSSRARRCARCSSTASSPRRRSRPGLPPRRRRAASPSWACPMRRTPPSPGTSPPSSPGTSARWPPRAPRPAGPCRNRQILVSK